MLKPLQRAEEADENLSELVPCTLFSGSYHLGVGALINSLYRSGFRGTVCVGYVPPLPPWGGNGKTDGNDTILEVASDLKVRFVPWTPQRNLSLEKPSFLLHILERAVPQAQGAVFFDADITVHGKWSFFERWLQQGIALCLDACYPLVPAGHPWRRGWRDQAVAAGYDQFRDLDFYANSGYIGVPRGHLGVLKCWDALIETFLCQNPDLADRVKFADRDEAFVSDQDLLNAALMATTAPLSIMGMEGMDFTPAGFTMAHAVAAKKPWQKQFLLSALGGDAVSRAEKSYWSSVEGPIRLFSDSYIFRKRLALKVAGAVGRFYRRA